MNRELRKRREYKLNIIISRVVKDKKTIESKTLRKVSYFYKLLVSSVLGLPVLDLLIDGFDTLHSFFVDL